MMQMINITNARRTLSGLVDKVSKGDEGVVIVSDSEPKAVLMPYGMVMKEEVAKKSQWQARFKLALRQGRVAGRKWAVKNGINLSKLSEEQKYGLVSGV